MALKEYLPAALALRGHGRKVTLRSQRHAETFARACKSFINEARLLARFDHPALVKVHRFWQANGTAYLVMPCYEGPTLKGVQAGHARTAHGRLDTPAAGTAARRARAHPRPGLPAPRHRARQHPDDRRQALLLDFGAARQLAGDMTQALTVILKPGYAPIEQYAEMPGIRQGDLDRSLRTRRGHSLPDHPDRRLRLR